MPGQAMFFTNPENFHRLFCPSFSFIERLAKAEKPRPQMRGLGFS